MNRQSIFSIFLISKSKMITVLMLMFASSSAFASKSGTFQPTIHQGVVSRIVDGDTIRFQPSSKEKGAKEWKIRFLGMDTPEHHMYAPGQGMVGQDPFGELATEYLQTLIKEGDPISLVSFGSDRYGRVLARLETKTEDINYEMVRSGWAIPYFICSGMTCHSEYLRQQKVYSYSDACHFAKTDQVGVFDFQNPLQEMPFEFRLRVQKRKPSRYVGNLRTMKLYQPADYNEVDVCDRIFFEKLDQAFDLGFSFEK